MKKNTIITKDHYTLMQFIFPEYKIDKNDPVRTFKTMMGGIELERFAPKDNTKGRKSYDFRLMCELVLYAYSTKIYSVRKIADACKNDIRFQWLSGGLEPSFMTISSFIKYQMGPHMKQIFAMINEYIEIHDDIDIDTIYIDGTKIEANANKYTFVWKKAVVKNQAKLFEKFDKFIIRLNEFYESCNIRYDFLAKGSYEPEDFIEVMESLQLIRNNYPCLFAQGKGKRKDEFQRYYEECEKLKEKALEYSEKIEICGTRNSYSKSDHDATFMHGKEDYYCNTGIFRAAYNIQIGVSDEYIRYIGVYQNPADISVYRRFMDEFHQMYGYYPKIPVGDAGYGGYDNYMYNIKHRMGLYLKYNSFEKDNKGTKERYFTKQEDGSYRCKNGKQLKYIKDSESSKNGAYRINQHYKVTGCEGCPFQDKCQKNKQENEREFSINVVLEEFHHEALKNLKSENGVQLRIQRSIQVEGAFGIIKADCGYDRMHRRGMENVKIEMLLLASGYNISKYHYKKVIRKIS